MMLCIIDVLNYQAANADVLVDLDLKYLPICANYSNVDLNLFDLVL